MNDPKTNEKEKVICPQCGTMAELTHGVRTAITKKYVHFWDCPVCGKYTSILGYDCVICLQIGNRNAHKRRKDTNAITTSKPKD